MEILKKMWTKTKLWVGLLVAGALVGFLALRKHVQDKLEADKQEQVKKEEAAKAEAEKKLAEEKAKLEAEKAEAEKKIEEERSAKAKEIVEKVKKKKEELKDLSDKDKQGFNKQVGKELGLKEKKKGRRKDDE